METFIIIISIIVVYAITFVGAILLFTRNVNSEFDTDDVKITGDKDAEQEQEEL